LENGSFASFAYSAGPTSAFFALEIALSIELLRRDGPALHHPLHDGELVILVVDRETPAPTDEMRHGAEQPRADGVERTNPHSGWLLAEVARNSLAHLARRLVRERHGENAPRVDALVADKSRDSRSENARLSRSRTGEHQ
jgi:hypothetical protein